MRFTTTHTQPSAVKRELIPLRQDLVCASSQYQQTLVQRTAQLPRDEGIVCGELRRPTLCRPTTYTVAVQDVEPFCALSFGSVATQSVPETSAFSNGPNLNFWRSSHSPQVAAHLPPCSSDSPNRYNHVRDPNNGGGNMHNSHTAWQS